ncbi:MAG TPA: protein phosphatase 2C domain-containing protein [Pyrinomonadaceae bacterium]|nr:protein phosphatase 2C domain-containing protein [Pyrinomonadaceae bacterium]
MDTSTRILSAAVSDRGLSEKRPQNEDSFLEMNKSGIFAVADGVGGAQAGEVASQMAMEILGEAFINLPTGADAETVMRTAIERANTAIHQMAHELPQLASMATTIVALHIDGSVATIGHVGDSRLYRVDREGDLYRETDDHSVVADEVRAGRMTEEQAENHPSRNVISRALGAEATVDVEIKTIMIEPGTSFLICSDGITRHVADAEIKGVLTFGGDPVDICEYLKGLCYERGAEDNLTAVVVKVSATAAPVDADAETIQFTAPLAIEEDEPTVASARPAFDVVEDQPELLELETRELVTSEVPDVASAIEEKLSEPLPENEVTPEPEIETAPEPSPETKQAYVVPSTPADQPFSMFGGEAEPSETEERSGSLGRIATAVVMLVIGSAIGLGVYHFALAPKAADTPLPQLSEMRSANIPLSAFEENRRAVDKFPAGYVQKNSSPQDAEDYYLVGRAHMLTGDYVKARTALLAARDRLAEADPTNADVLRDDIAILLAVTNDTTIQNMLKKEFEAVKKPANTNANVSSQ